jgi:hypothetical protein
MSLDCHCAFRVNDRLWFFLFDKRSSGMWYLFFFSVDLPAIRDSVRGHLRVLRRVQGAVEPIRISAQLHIELPRGAGGTGKLGAMGGFCRGVRHSLPH